METRNDKFELSNGSYLVSDIQDSFEYIIKTIRIYVNKKENTILFRINTGHYLKLLKFEKKEIT